MPTHARATAPLPRPLQGLVDAALDRWDTATAADARGPAVEALAAAIRGRHLRVVYQPIVDLTEHRPAAVEALVRLPDPPHPDLCGAPGIVEVAERSGLIDALGTDVLVQACSQLATWRRRPHLRDLQVNVNVSALQLRDDRFVEVVERTLQVTGLPPGALVLELTETAAFDADGMAVATLGTLTALDVAISIDDFGTGFASLELLAATPARSIKLDRSFVSSVGAVDEVPRGRALVVQAAIGLGRALGLRVVAEGIESIEQARTLSAWGCAFGQGYLFARPAPADELDLSEPVASPAAPLPMGGRSLSLSPEATDLALAVAAVVATATPDAGSLRAEAQELALLLAEVVGADRRHADTAAVLATIWDAPQRLADVVNPRSSVPAAAELARSLGAAPSVAADASSGALAAAARRLALARRDGEDLHPVLGTVLGGQDRDVVTRTATWWQQTRPSPSPLTGLRALQQRLRHRDDASRRLRSMSALTQAIGRKGSLEDVLEVTAEEARIALGAASLSICRLERDQGELRVLVNVGDLAPWEQPRPVHETYRLADFPVAAQRLLDRSINLEVIGTPDAHSSASELLGRLGKGSSAAVPIVFDGVSWGEVYATTARGAPPFTSADTPFLTAIAGVIGLAIQRSTHVEQLTQLASEDPLTRLANRRSLEGELTRRLAGEPEGPEVALLIVDIDGLKDINADFGSAEGDATLVRVGDVLSRASLLLPRSLAARLAGDEFCVLFEGDGAGAVELLQRVRRRLREGPAPQPRVSAGLAVVRPGSVGTGELIRRADAAQYLAKRTGAPLISVGPDGDIPEPDDLATAIPSGPAERPGTPMGAGPAAYAALDLWSHSLPGAPAVATLEALGEAAVSMLDLNRWVLSEVAPPGDTLTTRSVHVRRRQPRRTPLVPSSQHDYLIEDYPLTAESLRTGQAFAVHVDDVGCDPAERALLDEAGLRYVVALGHSAPGGASWLLELYGDDRSRPLSVGVALVEALASRSLGRDVRCTPSDG